MCVVGNWPTAVCADDDLETLNRCRLNTESRVIFQRKTVGRDCRRDASLEVSRSNAVHGYGVTLFTIEIAAKPHVFIVNAVHLCTGD